MKAVPRQKQRSKESRRRRSSEAEIRRDRRRLGVTPPKGEPTLTERPCWCEEACSLEDAVRVREGGITNRRCPKCGGLVYQVADWRAERLGYVLRPLTNEERFHHARTYDEHARRRCGCSECRTRRRERKDNAWA